MGIETIILEHSRAIERFKTSGTRWHFSVDWDEKQNLSCISSFGNTMYPVLNLGGSDITSVASLRFPISRIIIKRWCIAVESGAYGAFNARCFNVSSSIGSVEILILGVDRVDRKFENLKRRISRKDFRTSTKWIVSSK